MKYLLLSLLILGCSSAHIVKAPPDGTHLPVTVTCDRLSDCADLIEKICGNKQYLIDDSIRSNDVFRVSAHCN